MKLTFAAVTALIAVFAWQAGAGAATLSPGSAPNVKPGAVVDQPIQVHHRRGHVGGRGLHKGWYKKNRGKHKGWRR